MNAEQATPIFWDVVVIGTGMGGATCGLELAKAGKRVLFCERGKASFNNPDALTAVYPEGLVKPFAPLSGKLHSTLLANAGRYRTDIVDVTSGKDKPFLPLMGCGTGGSSALYGAGLVRFLRADFTPGRFFADDTEGAVVDAWPVAYDAMRPWYRAAERLYDVRGELDPLHAADLDPVKPPLPLTPAARSLGDHLRVKGLNPYAMPIACDDKEDCARCKCVLCPSNCKNDSAKVCLRPALEQHGASIIDECYALRFDADDSQVLGLRCIHHGQEIVIRGGLYVLAAGALESPALLLRSRSDAWPQGLANRSGLVGRYLMRHYVDLFLVYPEIKDGCNSDRGVIAYNDLYVHDGAKGGNVQSFGLMDQDLFLAGIQKDLTDAVGPWITPGYRMLRPLLKGILGRVLRGAYIFTSIVEDRPWLENRVYPTNDREGLSICYRAHPKDRQRLDAVRKRIVSAFAPLRTLPLYTADDNRFVSHACGTCRAGRDPTASVVDENNRAHGLANLYVTDASFFPSSAGINPSLTIAANALRVAAVIVADV